jgi:hypothetical protein
MKRKLLLGIILLLAFVTYKFTSLEKEVDVQISKIERKIINPTQKGKKKTLEERALYNEARDLHEYYRQVNPLTGEIPFEQKSLEKQASFKAKLRVPEGANLRAPEATFTNRGPDNLGGRTRTIAIDANNSNIILAGGVSGGVFRTTNGGTTWTKVSDFDEIHNVTTIVQDPTTTTTWYYGTGEGLGNSASSNGAGASAALYLGQGVWRSTDNGVTWTQMAGTAGGAQESYDNFFDIVYKLAVHPTTGDVFAAVGGRIYRYDVGTTTWIVEQANSGGNTSFGTDVVITTGGRVYTSFSGNQDAAIEGVWTSANGEGGWSRINAASFTPTGRVVLALAPSNQSKLYVLFVNGNTGNCTTHVQEADLWLYSHGAPGTWTDYTGVLPSEGCGGADSGNNPLSVQGGYDLVVSVKPDNENFVVIGGTNAYKKVDITAAGSRFIRIGGYNSPASYALYNTAGGVEHHPDIHALVFDTSSPNVLLSGTDGGIHKTNDITAGTTDWISLNNNYQTQQYYHVAIDPMSGSDYVIGGLQDNGTNEGGLSAGQPNLTSQARVFSGDGVAVGISRDHANVPIFVGAQSGTFYRLFRDSAAFANIEPTGSSSQFVTYFFLDPDNNKTLYFAGQGTLYRTNDATNVTAGTWTNMGTPTVFAGVSEWFQTLSTTWGAYNAATSYLLMGGDTGHILRLDDPQNEADFTNAIDITPPGATTTFPSIVTGLAIHPTNRDIVMATYSNYGTSSIFLTTNATSATPSWTLVERNLMPHSIRSAAIVQVAGETMYLVGTARGLYSTTDPTSVDWAREAPNLIGYAVVRAMAYRPSDNKLLIGTHGNGMFEADITQVLGVNDVDISDNIKIYPNPVENNLNIKLPSNLGNETRFTINNILGQEISKGDFKNNVIDVSQLQTGMYFLQISAEGRKGVKQFIKK